MNILMTGASGLLGSKINAHLSTQHHIIALGRNTTTPPCWDSAAGSIELGEEREIDVIINLAGENISEGRWTKAKKERILRSRVDGTALLARFCASAAYRPKLLISCSAVGFYGDRDDETLDETNSNGDGFLADVCRQWEAATLPAQEAGVRVVHIRLGMVLSADGGALAKMYPIFRRGLGGVMGNGRQYMSWISINDVVTAIEWIMQNEDLSGPVNLVAPEALSNRHFTKCLGKVLRRPTLLPLPALIAHIIFGEMAEELLLSSTRALPQKLLESGYEFRDPDLAIALAANMPR